MTNDLKRARPPTLIILFHLLYGVLYVGASGVIVHLLFGRVALGLRSRPPGVGAATAGDFFIGSVFYWVLPFFCLSACELVNWAKERDHRSHGPWPLRLARLATYGVATLMSLSGWSGAYSGSSGSSTAIVSMYAVPIAGLLACLLGYGVGFIIALVVERDY
jgi:hypothetical protein